MKYTKKEDTYIRQWYGKLTSEKIGEHLNRCSQGVRRRAGVLGLAFVATNRWTAMEIETLRKHHPKKTFKELSHILGRSEDLIRQKASALGLKKRLPLKDGDIKVVTSKGVNRVMIRIDGRMKSYRKYVWEQNKGKLPVGYKLIAKDGDPLNCNIENLEVQSGRFICLMNNPRLTTDEAIAYDMMGALKNLHKLNRSKNGTDINERFTQHSFRGNGENIAP